MADRGTIRDSRGTLHEGQVIRSDDGSPRTLSEVVGRSAAALATCGLSEVLFAPDPVATVKDDGGNHWTGKPA
jgi:hypothetical protein